MCPFPFRFSASLESALKRCALEFYSDETKHAKKRKEKLSKIAHLKLLVRASYKMAYYSELCNDFTSAVKHYSTAYTQLRDVKKNWKDFDEIKVVAEILNFRLCYLHLERNTPSNATTQFHQHVNYYRSLIGDPDREFQHYAWMSRQFQLFGELLQLFSFLAPPPSGSSITPSSSSQSLSSLSSSQLSSSQGILGGSRSRGWTHPGFYFQAAANYEMMRRASANKLCTPQRSKDIIQRYLPLVHPFRSSAIDFNAKNSYVGQKAETAVVNLDSFHAEKDGKTMTVLLEAIQNNATEVAVAQELHVNHSKEVIHLLNVAQDAYRLDHTPNDRTIWHLISQIAQESFLAGDYTTTKTHNDLVIPHYRREKWWGLLAICLKTNFQCAISSRQWHDALLIAAELLSPSYPSSSIEERKYYLLAISKIIYAHRNSKNGENGDITSNGSDIAPKDIYIPPMNPLLLAASPSIPDKIPGLSSSSSSIGSGVPPTSSSPTPGSSDSTMSNQQILPQSSLLVNASSGNTALPSFQIPWTSPVVISQSSNTSSSLVNCQVTFPQQSASIKDTISVKATLTSNFPMPVRFDRFVVSFSDETLDITLQDESKDLIAKELASLPNGAPNTSHKTDAELPMLPLGTKQVAEIASLPNSLVLLPNKPKSFSLQLSLSKVAKIQCTGATLTWGAAEKSLQLKWDWTPLHKLNTPVATSIGSDYSQRRQAESVSLDVLQLTPKLDLQIEHENEALEGERLPITINIQNGEDSIVRGTIRITPYVQALGSETKNNASASQQGAQASSNNATSVGSAGNCPFVSETGTNDADIHEIPVGKIEANEFFSSVVYFVAPRRQREEPYVFKVSFIYDTETYSTTAERALRLPIRAPFEVSFGVYDSEFRDIPIGQYRLIVRKDASSEPLQMPLLPESSSGAQQGAQGAQQSSNNSASPPAPLLHSDSTTQMSLVAHKVVVGECFYIHVELKSAFDLQLQNVNIVSLQTDPPFQNLTPSVPIEPNEFSELRKGSQYSSWFIIKATAPINQSLGMLSIRWKRLKPLSKDTSSKDDLMPTSNTIAQVGKSNQSLSAATAPHAKATNTPNHWQTPLVSIFAETPAFTTKLNCSPTATLGKPLEHELVLKNHTDNVLCLALEVEEANSGFATSGDLKAQYRLNAFAQLHVKHTLVPLLVGTQRCPKFHIKHLSNDGSGLGPGGIMEHPYNTIAHTDIFVEPNQQAPLIV